MNKILQFFLFYFFSLTVGLAQEINTIEIFEVNSLAQLILKPEIEERINIKIEPLIEEKLEKYKSEKLNVFKEYTTENEHVESLNFVRDTIRINEFLKELQNTYSKASTTTGMNWMATKYLAEYDSLLNEYYIKAKNVLAIEMQEQLVQSQNKWLSYYENEVKFIYNLNDFGTSSSNLYCWGFYMDMVQKRVLFLREIYQRNFHNINAFKAN